MCGMPRASNIQSVNIMALQKGTKNPLVIVVGTGRMSGNMTRECVGAGRTCPPEGKSSVDVDAFRVDDLQHKPERFFQILQFALLDCNHKAFPAMV